MILSTSDFGGKKLIAIKFKNKWRMASRFVGRLHIEYEVGAELPPNKR